MDDTKPPLAAFTPAERRGRVKRMRERYMAYREKFGKKPLFYRGRDKWTEIPKEFS